MRPVITGRRGFPWHALRIGLILSLLALRAHAGVVVIDPGMIPVAGHSVLPQVACDASAASITLGLNHSEFPVTCHPFTLDWLARVSSSWPALDATGESHSAAAHPPADDARMSSIQSAKWLGVCGALLLLMRRSLRR